MTEKKKLFMAVYNEIDYDGRVLRSAECLAKKYNIKLFAVNAQTGYSNSLFVLEPANLAWFRKSGILRYLYFSILLIVAAVRYKPDIIYSHDYFTSMPSKIASIICGAVLIYDSHELIIPEDGLKLSRRDSLFYFFESTTLKSAALIIAANRERANLMQEHYRLGSAPLVIQNISAYQEERLETAELYRRYPKLERKNQNTIRLVFQGYLSADRGVISSIEAMKSLPPNFELILVGSGPKSDMIAIDDAINLFGVENRVILLGRVPREHLFDILRTCDIGIVYYHTRTLNHLYCASNKIYEYAQAGLPSICTCQPPLRSIHEKYHIGELIGCGSEDDDGQILDIVRAGHMIAIDIDSYRDRIHVFLSENTWEAEADILLGAVDKCIV